MKKSNNVPRRYARYAEIIFQEDASGWQTFKYGKLGELNENIRTFALPFENQTYTFAMQYKYDPFNRIQSILYPDSELVEYSYNLGGMLTRVTGSVTRKYSDLITPNSMQKQGGGFLQGGNSVQGINPGSDPIEGNTVTIRYPYLDSIVYNKFELKDSVIYGNGTRVSYEYDSLQRLSHLRSYTASGTKMQNITYTYDGASNITHISNSAGSVSGLGGRYEGHYTYDNLYRLVAANGYWKNSIDSLPFSESMNYTANGRILKKTVNARILNGNHSTTKSSDFRYSYASHSNQVSTITDGALPIVTQSFLWDDCGNVDRWAMLSKTGIQWLRTHTWTEDNRLQTVADNNWFSYYQYDAGGERTYKLTWAGSTSNRSGDRSIYYTPDEATLYASPYLVITPQGYTKHYYAEAERITSQLGKGQFVDVGTPVVNDSLVQVKLQAVTGNVEYPATLTIPSSGAFAYLDTLTNQQNATSTLYFYHPDHLGSSSWITTTNGTVKQHLHYLPWGETYVDQKSNRFDGVRYTFSAKEKDAETGYSYFGARYYSSDLSVWLSVDPMSDKYPSLSPYVYCADNPVKLVDPNGEEIGGPDDPPTKYIIKKGDTFWNLENARNLPHGTLQRQNPSLDPNNLQVGTEINYPYMQGDLIISDNSVPTGDIPEYYNQPTSSGPVMDMSNYNAVSPLIAMMGIQDPRFFKRSPVTNAKFTYKKVCSIRSFEDIVRNPKLLWGKSQQEMEQILGKGWTGGKYGNTGEGWKFTKGDKSVFYHNGGRHQGPYYGFSSGKTGKVKVVGKGYVPSSDDKSTIIYYTK